MTHRDAALPPNSTCTSWPKIQSWPGASSTVVLGKNTSVQDVVLPPHITITGWPEI
jgi:hypothetical protein